MSDGSLFKKFSAAFLPYVFSKRLYISAFSCASLFALYPFSVPASFAEVSFLSVNNSTTALKPFAIFLPAPTKSNVRSFVSVSPNPSTPTPKFFIFLSRFLYYYFNIYTIIKYYFD